MTVGIVETHRQTAMPDVLDVVADVHCVVGGVSSGAAQIDSSVLVVECSLAIAGRAGNTPVVIARAREVCIGDIVLIYSNGTRVIDLKVCVLEELMLNRGADQVRVRLRDIRLDPAKFRRRKSD